MDALNPISINGNTIDPAAPAVRAAGLGTDNASDSNYILIQTKHALKKDDKHALKNRHVDVQERVGDSTYLCRYEDSDLGPVRELDFVKWASIYSTHFVVSAKLKGDAVARTSSPMAVLSTHPHTVDVIFHQGHKKDIPKLKELVAHAAHVDAAGLTGTKRKVRLVVQERYLQEVAEIDDVQAIEEVRANKLFNNVARNILMGNGGIDDQNDVIVGNSTLRGAGQIVAVADTGVDETHPAFRGRIQALFPTVRGSLTNDTQGHGTHVCGSVLGDATLQDGTRVQGTAPEAKLVMQSIGDSRGGLGGIPNDLNDLFQQVYDAGARVHSNSWGDVTSGQPYDPSASEIDQFIYEHPDMVICFAAGNDGIDQNRDGISDLRQIGTQAAAKNCITVGASENLRPGLQSNINGQIGSLMYGFQGFAVQNTGFVKFQVNPMKSDPLANNLDGMAAFSSRGPTQEARIKPDVVAPGTAILSARARGVRDSGLFGISNDPAWMYDTGTSMATPLVSGCVAVLRQALVQNAPPNAAASFPSAALVKALLINGAVDLNGQYRPSEAGPSPNYSSGWGRVQLTNSVNAAVASQYIEGTPLEDDDSAEFDVDVPNGGLTLKATLVWTDPPKRKLQNDLELAVTAGNQIRKGNTGPNRENNVEQVVWQSIPAGKAKIRITALTLTTDTQAYAVAWNLSS